MSNNSLIDDKEEIEFGDDQDSEESQDLSNNRRIYTEAGDLEISSLLGKKQRGRLIIQPEYQRQFVWDKDQSSRLIESALLDIPLPVIYLSEEKDGKENVIDGQQRLTSFFSFIEGKFPNDSTDFKLSGLKVFSELNGKRFKDLSDELQDKISYYRLRTIKFKKESDNDLQFEIFARLNTGSTPLNDQELRNCVYRGKFNALLKELSEDATFRNLLGLTSDKRMRARELVLRFASFYFNSYLNYKAPIKAFLNHTMEKYRDISSVDEQKLRLAFKNTVNIIKSLLDENAFKRFYDGNAKNKNGRWEAKKINVSLFDILMDSFSKVEKNIIYQNLDRIREAFIDIMTTDQSFIDSIELSTSSVQAVRNRFDKWRLTLEKIIGIDQKEPRCFTNQLKKELFNNNNTCAICGNTIVNIDDCAVDHINQYWTGGKTIPENARLAHRYCNNARSLNDSISTPIAKSSLDDQKVLNGMPSERFFNQVDKKISSDIKRFNIKEPALSEFLDTVGKSIGKSLTKIKGRNLYSDHEETTVFRYAATGNYSKGTQYFLTLSDMSNTFGSYQFGYVAFYCSNIEKVFLFTYNELCLMLEGVTRSAEDKYDFRIEETGNR